MLETLHSVDVDIDLVASEAWIYLEIVSACRVKVFVRSSGAPTRRAPPLSISNSRRVVALSQNFANRPESFIIIY